ncbi:hypothetical protein C8R47DRAFT_1155765 [Mycena vitilis]|nr:hypothetical protein C8R47DRAFT_1155765 [Mycena vitilis]
MSNLFLLLFLACRAHIQQPIVSATSVILSAALHPQRTGLVDLKLNPKFGLNPGEPPDEGTCTCTFASKHQPHLLEQSSTPISTRWRTT